jgi:2-polyprenyl-3-methyl-5-hydroxy-6-metoxy-1,4-benzoquinol methylase
MRYHFAYILSIWGLAMDAHHHWEKIYTERAPTAVSWYRPHLETSLALIGRVASKDSMIIDVGGGESTLVDDLLSRGYENVTVLDISHRAIEENKKRLSRNSERVQWRVADIREAELPESTYDVWHDRAVFHFLTQASDRAAYIRQVVHAVKPGGHVIVSTFGLEGPTRCSGLDVVRYDPESLHGEFGAQLRLIESLKELHQTPFGTVQQFIYCHCKLE